MKEVAIVGYLRTAQSRSRPNDPGRDWFHALRADELLAGLLPEIIARTGLAPEEIDDFLVGSAIGVNEQWTYGGRTPVFLANLPETIPAKFVDQRCGSAMAGIHVGFMEIAQGFADVVMVGGMEHMTRVPISPATFDRGYLSPNLNLYTSPDYAHWDMSTAPNMGLTAEKLLSQTNYTREDMDRWAERSHTRAVRAREDVFFDSEILPLKALQADGYTLTVKTDQAVRADVRYEELAALKPAFKKDGLVTAGTSSPLNAGASAMILMSRGKAEEKGITPMAVIRSIGFAGVDPTIMGHGPVPASQKALAALGMSPEKIDFWEINEAFAIVVLNCIQALGLDPDRVNVTGGGLAIGHPLGASGIRLVGTLARILAEKDARWGCANACCGGGQGVATIIERLAN